MKLKGFISVIVAAALAATIFSANTVSALTLTSGDGDINQDSLVQADDLSLLNKYILKSDNSGNTLNAAASDINKDGVSNISDSLLLKHILLYGIAEGKEILPVQYFSRSVPSKGSVNIPIISVQFADIKYNATVDDATYPGGTVLSTSQIEANVFGAENKASSNYPFESSSAYYKRASYGQLTMDGDVFSYTASKARSKYESSYESLIMEAMSALNSSIDYSKYDSNGDRIIDAMVISVPLDGSDSDLKWWGCQGTWYENPNYTVDGMRLGSYIINDAQPMSNAMAYYNDVLCHELGHAMGLPDYYEYFEDDSEQFHGTAGHELMEDMVGDLSSFSKLLLGWCKTDEIQVANLSSGSGTYYLSPIDKQPDMLIIPVGKLDDNYFSEYFLVEYDSGTGNNSKFTGSGGIRVFHVDATVKTSEWNSSLKMFKYENYSSDYSATHKILQLVNDSINTAFYTSGTIASGANHFACYDSTGNETIDTGFEINIKGLTTAGTYQIDVVKK